MNYLQWAPISAIIGIILVIVSYALFTNIFDVPFFLVLISIMLFINSIFLIKSKKTEAEKIIGYVGIALATLNLINVILFPGALMPLPGIISVFLGVFNTYILLLLVSFLVLNRTL